MASLLDFPDMSVLELLDVIEATAALNVRQRRQIEANDERSRTTSAEVAAVMAATARTVAALLAPARVPLSGEVSARWKFYQEHKRDPLIIASATALADDEGLATTGQVSYLLIKRATDTLFTMRSTASRLREARDRDRKV